MKKHYVWNKNFTLLVIGHIISLFGNAMLRFSLSLYVLDTTGSASAFATILAISMIPTILLSPVGGVLADRMSRRHISRYLLDCFTGFLLLSFTYLITQASSFSPCCHHNDQYSRFFNPSINLLYKLAFPYWSMKKN